MSKIEYLKALKPFYIYGRPLETDIGTLHFITVGEWYDFVLEGYLSVLTMEKCDVENQLKSIVHLDSGVQIVLDVLKFCDFFTFIKNIGESVNNETDIENTYLHALGLVDLYQKMREMFEFCFKEDVFHKITSQEEFDSYRGLIMDINCITHEKPNPNPEIERFNQMKRLLQQHKGDDVTFDSMYTSVGLALGKDPDNMTMYKFYKYFERLMQFKNYDTSVLFATVSDKVKVEPWYKKVEYKEDTQITISEEQLKNKSVSIDNILTK